MIVRRRYRAPLFYCDVVGCDAQRASNTGGPRGWAVVVDGGCRRNLCPEHAKAWTKGERPLLQRREEQILSDRW